MGRICFQPFIRPHGRQHEQHDGGSPYGLCSRAKLQYIIKPCTTWVGPQPRIGLVLSEFQVLFYSGAGTTSVTNNMQTTELMWWPINNRRKTLKLGQPRPYYFDFYIVKQFQPYYQQPATQATLHQNADQSSRHLFPLAMLSPFGTENHSLMPASSPFMSGQSEPITVPFSLAKPAYTNLTPVTNFHSASWK